MSDIERVTLAELRSRFGVSQDALAVATASSQPAIKKLEGAADPRLSTLRRFVHGLGEATHLGGVLEVRAVLGGESFMIDLPDARPKTAMHVQGDGPAIATAWRLRAWDDPFMEKALLTRSVIAISADEIGDVSTEPSPAEYRSRLRAAPELQGRSEQAIGQFAGYWQMFRSRMQEGDIVAVPLSGRRVAIGEIDGPYEYLEEEPEPRLRHVRRVRWLVSDLDRALLDDDLRRVVNAPGTVCAFRALQAAHRLRVAAS